VSQAAGRSEQPRGLHAWRHAVWPIQHGPRPPRSRATAQSARIGTLVFGSAAAIGFAAGIVSAPYARPELTMAGAVVAAVTIAVALPVLRRPHLVLLAAVVLLYYAALTLVLLGDYGQSEGLLALVAIPVIASALYGPRSLTVATLLAATATLACDGVINALTVADYAQLLTVWPITGMGIAYTVHQLRSQLERTVAEREAVIQHDATLALIADELYAAYDGDQVLQLGLQSAARLTALPGEPESKAVFFLVEDDHATLVASYSPDVSDDAGPDPRIDRVSVSLSATTRLRDAVANHDDRLFVLDRSTPVPSEISAVLGQLDIENAIVQLMRVGDAGTGLLAVFNSDAAAPAFIAAQRAWLQGLAPLLELALSRAFVFEAQTTTDQLTGIANRREIDHRLDRMARSAVYSLLAIDIDKLKSMNDTFGHQAGDELIRVVAEALHRAVRRGDVAARVGGDEFCVILTDADDQRAEAFASRIFGDLGTRSIHGEQPRISIGIASFGSGLDAAARLAAADKALYDAKRSGGNRATHAPLLDTASAASTSSAPLVVPVGGASEAPINTRPSGSEPTSASALP
jgi:diguanylate cyclase (GGDEF)-like protein